jgi:hypothetical protein
MGMFGTSWRVARIAGIEVRIDSSWVVIALLITYSMYLRLSVLYRELSGGGAIALAVLSAVLFCGGCLTWVGRERFSLGPSSTVQSSSIRLLAAVLPRPFHLADADV